MHVTGPVSAHLTDKQEIIRVNTLFIVQAQNTDKQDINVGVSFEFVAEKNFCSSHGLETCSQNQDRPFLESK